MTDRRRLAWAVGIAGVLALVGRCAGSAPPASVAYTPVTPVAMTSLSAVTALGQLAVAGPAPMSAYGRELFGDAWADDNDDADGHNGCDTRNDILRRDLAQVSLDPSTSGCVVLGGVLPDPYTGASIAFTRGKGSSEAVEIDHVVALGDAWQTGAQLLSQRTRQDLANDPLELLAVSGPANVAKSDGDAAAWLPPNSGFWCGYVARQIAVKRKYGLWVTGAERDAMTKVLQACPGQTIPEG